MITPDKKNDWTRTPISPRKGITDPFSVRERERGLIRDSTENELIYLAKD